MRRYRELMSKRTIIWGRTYNFAHLECVRFEHLMEQMGWTFFYQIRETGYGRLVRGFYASAHTILGVHGIHCSLKGIDFTITQCLLSRLLALPMDGYRLIISNTWPVFDGFDPQHALQRICLPDRFSPKPRITDLTLEA